MRNNSVCYTEVSGLKTTSRDRIFDAHAPHRHHIIAPQQCCMQGRPPTRAIGPKLPSEHVGAMRADHEQSTVSATSSALASPRTPQPRYQSKDLVELRQRVSGLLMDSKNCSRKVLPKGEQRVSKEEALTAQDKETTMRPPRAR